MRRVSFITPIALVASILFSVAVRAEHRPTITRLELRDRTVEIASTSQGLSYSVLSQDGTVLDANLNENQLAEKHPELYEKVRPAVAKDTDNRQILWMGDFPTK